MAIDRRGFLRSLLGGAVGLAIAPTLDLDKLLWVPGAKSIFLPAVPRITLAEIDEITRRVILPGVVDNFFKSAPLLSYLKSHNTGLWYPSTEPRRVPITLAGRG